MSTEQTHGSGTFRCGKCKKLLAKGCIEEIGRAHV